MASIKPQEWSPLLLLMKMNICRASPQEASTARCNELSPSNLDTLKLTDLRPKRTWHEVHEDFYKEPPANPGKILLLYSPDSLAFKELQASFRSFLELACHCVVLDLFDEELLQAIAYDPEAWIDQLLRDDRFKVIVVCSQVAYTLIWLHFLGLVHLQNEISGGSKKCEIEA